MQPTFCMQVRLVCFFRRLVDAKSARNASNSNECLIRVRLVSWHMANTEKSNLSSAALDILRIDRCSCVAQVVQSVVCFVSVDVINSVFRVGAKVNSPCDSMPKEILGFVPNVEIPIRANCACQFASHRAHELGVCPRPSKVAHWSISPAQFSRIWVIGQQLTKSLGAWVHGNIVSVLREYRAVIDAAESHAADVRSLLRAWPVSAP